MPAQPPALEGLLPILQRCCPGYEFENGTTVKTLAFADDLCVIGMTKDGTLSLVRES